MSWLNSERRGSKTGRKSKLPPAVGLSGLSFSRKSTSSNETSSMTLSFVP